MHAVLGERLGSSLGYFAINSTTLNAGLLEGHGGIDKADKRALSDRQLDFWSLLAHTNCDSTHCYAKNNRRNAILGGIYNAK